MGLTGPPRPRLSLSPPETGTFACHKGLSSNWPRLCYSCEKNKWGAAPTFEPQVQHLYIFSEFSAALKNEWKFRFGHVRLNGIKKMGMEKVPKVALSLSALMLWILLTLRGECISTSAGVTGANSNCTQWTCRMVLTDEREDISVLPSERWGREVQGSSSHRRSY